MEPVEGAGVAWAGIGVILPGGFWQRMGSIGRIVILNPYIVPTAKSGDWEETPTEERPEPQTPGVGFEDGSPVARLCEDCC